MLYTFHLVKLPLWRAAALLMRAPRWPGLMHAEPFTVMELGAPIISLKRMNLTRVALFARWESEAALESFLVGHRLGPALTRGWHARMDFLRRWGHVAELPNIPEHDGRTRFDDPVAVVTLARTRLWELPRFIRWGRPVEKQIRDHPQSTLALAAMRAPRTFSTFSMWESAAAMVSMVFGDDAGAQGKLHAEAMRERERRDFHKEFTTLRFTVRSEHGDVGTHM